MLMPHTNHFYFEIMLVVVSWIGTHLIDIS
jgi:hypothetical protein